MVTATLNSRIGRRPSRWLSGIQINGPMQEVIVGAEPMYVAVDAGVPN
jgi:hypothetical protein